MKPRQYRYTVFLNGFEALQTHSAVEAISLVRLAWEDYDEVQIFRRDYVPVRINPIDHLPERAIYSSVIHA